MGVIQSTWMRLKTTATGAPRHRICYLHIPKCGGSSINDAIRRAYIGMDFRDERQVAALDAPASSSVVAAESGRRYPFDTDDDRAILRFREQLLCYLLAQPHIRYVTGHFPYSERARQWFGQDVAFMTLLRHPHARFVSSYAYNRYKNPNLRVDVDFDTFLSSPFGQSQGYELVKFIGGPREDGDYRSAAALENAKRNIERFALVGFLEDLPGFSRAFRRRFGVRLRVPHLNRTPGHVHGGKLLADPVRRKQVAELCAPDMAIYEHARRISAA